MALQISTGARNKILDTSPFRTVFNLCFLSIYNGTVPTTADAALSGNTLLCRYTNNNTATGLTFAASASGGSITKTLAETWSHNALNSGTATFFRLEAAGDSGALSTTEARLQGLVALAGGELNLSTLSFVASTLYSIDNFSFALPTL